MAGLLSAIAARSAKLVYVFEKSIDEDRERQGWRFPSLDTVETARFTCEQDVLSLVSSASADSIHVCDGLRGNPLMQYVQECLWSRGLRQWLTMETVDDDGTFGFAKRLEYSRLFRKWRDRLQGVLAIGTETPGWIVSRGMPSDRTFPFAYFLSHAKWSYERAMPETGSFRIAFVGQFIDRKRLGLLIRALARLADRDFVLTVIGSGADEERLRNMAQVALGRRVDWIGRLPIDIVPTALSKVDCLVLPSRHDGWGAVVSEAMMVGTPAICSDGCGCHGVVRASGHGDVFLCDDTDGLTVALDCAIARGRVTHEQRTALVAWARCLGANAGAEYFLSILDHVEGAGAAPPPPWCTMSARTRSEDGFAGDAGAA